MVLLASERKKNHVLCECAGRVLSVSSLNHFRWRGLRWPWIGVNLCCGLTLTCVGRDLVIWFDVLLMWIMILAAPHQRVSLDHMGSTRVLRSFAVFISCYPGTRCPCGSHPTVPYDPGLPTSEMSRKIIYTHPPACTVCSLFGHKCVSYV